MSFSSIGRVGEEQSERFVRDKKCGDVRAWPASYKHLGSLFKLKKIVNRWEFQGDVFLCLNGRENLYKRCKHSL